MSRSKKIYVGCILFFLFLTIVSRLVTDYRKKQMKTLIDKGTMLYPSQTRMLMAKDGNIKWFEQKDYLKEEYDYQDILKNSYIHEAVRNKRYELISYLIKQNKRFNRRNSEGYYPISLAAKMCDLKMVKILEPVNRRNAYDAHAKTAEMYLKECEGKKEKN